MKNLILTITALVSMSIINLLNAQAPNWVWANSAGGTEEDFSRSIATDANGNSIITGYFRSPTINFGTTTLTNAGIRDVFIAKYDTSGNVVWANSAGSTFYDEGYCLATDASGNIFMTGVFNSPTITFGSTTLFNAGTFDIFITKYDVNGNVLWAKEYRGASFDFSYSLCTDTFGNVFLAGAFSSTTITFDTITLTNTGNSDIFIAKYDANGNVLWAKSALGADNESSYSIATDASGNLFMTGKFKSPVLTIGASTLTNVGSYDLFIVKYDANGNVLWAKSVGGIDDDEGFGITTVANGNAIITGYFRLPIAFGPTTLSNVGSYDVFIAKYDANGNVLWANSAGGVDGDYANSIATDANGGVFMTGYFSSPAITFGTTNLNNTANGDIFIVNYDTGGNVLWAKSEGGVSFDAGYSVASDKNGNLLMTGMFNSSSITFGNTTLTNNASSGDIFIAKLDTTMTTGIETTSASNGFFIYPNPASDILTITKWQWAMGKDVTISISDITGKLIYTTTATTSKTEVNTKDFSKGVYLIKLQSKDFVETRKVIKN